MRARISNPPRFSREQMPKLVGESLKQCLMVGLYARASLKAMLRRRVVSKRDLNTKNSLVISYLSGAGKRAATRSPQLAEFLKPRRTSYEQSFYWQHGQDPYYI